MYKNLYLIIYFVLCNLTDFAFGQIDYNSQIQTIFSNTNCTNCHGNSAGLNLSSYSNLMNGSNNGAVITPFNHATSELWMRVNSGDMPPNETDLTSAQVNLIAQWIDEGAYSQPAGCTDMEAYNCEGSLNGEYSTDIGGIVYNYSCNGTTPPGTEWTENCSAGEVCEGYYNPDAEVDNGICYYYQAPSASEVVFTVETGSITLDWSNFDPPALANVVDYHLQRCIGSGCIPFDTELTEFTDNVDWNSNDDLKYVISVNYEINPYWGFANSEPLNPLGLAGCIDPEAYNCEGSLNGDYSMDIGGIIYNYSCDGTTDAGTESCSAGEVCEGYYNPDAEVNNGVCYYYQAPSNDEVEFTDAPGIITLDWSAFESPNYANIEYYRVSRCIGSGCTQLENIETDSYSDEWTWEDVDQTTDAIHYVISVQYENNPYWGWANSEQLDPFECGAALGDLNGDGGFNVLDIVTLANCVLNENCATLEFGCAADINGDTYYNVLDIVTLANCVLNEDCSSRVDDASYSKLIIRDNIVLIEADGFIGGVQMTLQHGDDFTIEMTDMALHADYITSGNETRLLVITPGTDELFSFSGDFDITEIIVANSQYEVSVDFPLATSYSLSEAYPNPFNPTTTMTLTMPVSGDIRVEVYNLLGQEVSTLASGYMEGGTYTLTWDASDVSSGMYFVKAETHVSIQTQKLLLLK